MSSKFYGLKGKINKAKPKTEAVVVDAEVLVDEKEIEALMESLNEEVVEEVVDDGIVITIAEPIVTPTDMPERNTMNHIAYNIFWDNVNRAYGLCTLEYNLSKNTARIVESKVIADNPAVALHKLNGLISLKLLKKEEVF